MKRVQVGLVGLMLLGLWMTVSRAPRERVTGSLGQRLLGPVAELASAWQWVRVRVALDAGRTDLAFARAELALDLDPRATGGWSFLAAMLAFERASPDREPNPALRQRWTEVALDVLERGEQSARHPLQLALERGVILVHVGNLDGEIPWPGGASAAWHAAQSAFERAALLDPGSSEPWAQLAANACLRLASPALEPDFQGRQARVQQALDQLQAALPVVREPAPLHFQRGLLLGFLAESSDGPRYPGGRVQLYSDAIDALRHAEHDGFPLAREAREGAEEALAKLR